MAAEVVKSPPSPASLPSPKLKPGSLILGLYELGKLLGHGSFAKVYVARHAHTGAEVAIKVLDKAAVLQAGLMAHIKREIAILRRVRHPNIVHLFEVLASKSKIYIVMEYVRGGELFARVSKGRLPEDSARRYFHQLVSALSFCHARGVFHRDIKPENLLLDGTTGDLKVSDFGLSAVSDQASRQPDGLFQTFCGTPAYLAPEVLSRRGYDAAKADTWSCGIVLYVLMAGGTPFHDRSLPQMYRKIYSGKFRCPGWFSPDLVRLVKRLLDTNPNSRITIPELMADKWFKKGYRPTRFYIEDDRFQFHPHEDVVETPQEERDDTSESGNESDSSVSSCPATTCLADCRSESVRAPKTLSRPASLNAFDIISFSPAFNLSGLFEERGQEPRFVSTEPVPDIISKLEEIAKLVSFTVRKKDCRVSLEGTTEGVKGPLTIAAEIFELTPSLVVVEIKKKSGDKEEYDEFCEKELKPGLRKLMCESPAVAGLSSAETSTH